MPTTGAYTRSGFYQMFDESKRYLGLRAQEFVPAVDADFNDWSDSIVTQLRRIISTIIGDKAQGSAFLIDEALSPTNNFLITGGNGTLDGAARLFLAGYPSILESDVNYTDTTTKLHSTITALSDTVLSDDSANWNVNELVGRELQANVATAPATITIISNTANTITVAGGLLAITAVGNYYRVELSTPGGARTDSVYLDVFVDEIDSSEDPNLVHTVGSPSVVGAACLRLGLRTVIKVRQNSSTIPSTFTDSTGRIHYYLKIATLNRIASASVLSAQLVDEREVFSVISSLGDGLEELVPSEASVKAANTTIDVASAGIKAPTVRHQYLAPSVTTTDEDPISLTSLSHTPANAGFIQLFINGLLVKLDLSGTKTEAAYFSSDGGTTAKTAAAVASGDLVYWMGSVAGYEISLTDEIVLIVSAT